jgi:transcription elongation factor Elf1
MASQEANYCPKCGSKSPARFSIDNRESWVSVCKKCETKFTYKKLSGKEFAYAYLSWCNATTEFGNEGEDDADAASCFIR